MAKESLGYQGCGRTSHQTNTVKNELGDSQNRKRRNKLVIQEEEYRPCIYGKKIGNHTAPTTPAPPCKKENHHNSTYPPVKNVGKRDLSFFEISGVLSTMQNENSPSLSSSSNTKAVFRL